MARKRMSGLAKFNRARSKRQKGWKKPESQLLIDSNMDQARKLCKAYAAIMLDTYNKVVKDRILDKDKLTWAKIADLYNSIHSNPTEYEYVDAVLNYYSTKSDLSWKHLASANAPTIFNEYGDKRAKENAHRVIYEVRGLYSLLPMMTSPQDIIEHMETNNFHDISKYIIIRKCGLEIPIAQFKHRVLNDNNRTFQLQEIIDKLLVLEVSYVDSEHN